MNNEHFYIIVYRLGDKSLVNMESYYTELNLDIITYRRSLFCPTAEKVWAVEITETEFDDIIKNYPPTGIVATDTKSQGIIHDKYFVPKYLTAKSQGQELRWNFNWEHEMVYQRMNECMGHQETK